MLAESEHMDKSYFVADPEFRRGGSKDLVKDTPEIDNTPYINANDHDPSMPEHPAQDFHKMLQACLASYKELQDTEGFEFLLWDLQYRGKTWHLLCVPFIMMVKGDGKEGDKHALAYLSKTNICCVC